MNWSLISRLKGSKKIKKVFLQEVRLAQGAGNFVGQCLQILLTIEHDKVIDAKITLGAVGSGHHSCHKGRGFPSKQGTDLRDHQPRRGTCRRGRFTDQRYSQFCRLSQENHLNPG